MTHSAFPFIRPVRLHPVAQAAAVVLLSTASHVAQAAVTYLPPCGVCTIDSTPAAGDEWVIQGNQVSFGATSLTSEGLLTNNARTLTSGHNLHVMGGLNNKTRFNNTGSLLIAGLVSPTFNNTGTFTNAGDVTVYTSLANAAGRLINNGSITVNRGEVTNHAGAIITNNASFQFTNGKLTNQKSGVVNNYGNVFGVGSTLGNQGVFNNRAGILNVSQIANTGQIVNSLGAKVAIGKTLVNDAGGKLVNRGVIEAGVDSSLILNQGSDYDFRGGMLNVTSMGRLYLNRDFTIGDAKGGIVNLGFDGRVINSATLRVTGTQSTASNISNSGAIINSGNWQHEAALTGAGTVSNRGTFTVDGFVQTSAYSQTAGKTVVAGEASLGQAEVLKGTVEVQGGSLSADTLSLKGGLIANGGTLNVGSMTVASTGWLALTDSSLVVTGDFFDNSLLVSKWATGQASLAFTGAGPHKFGVGPGSHEWDALTLDGAGSYEFLGGNTLTVGTFTIAGGDLSLLDAIQGDTTIYYDASLAANAYLNGMTYSFGQGSGQLVASGAPLFEALPMAMGLPSSVTAVPEAEHWMLALAGLAVVGLRRRRFLARTAC